MCVFRAKALLEIQTFGGFIGFFVTHANAMGSIEPDHPHIRTGPRMLPILRQTEMALVKLCVDSPARICLIPDLFPKILHAFLVVARVEAIGCGHLVRACRHAPHLLSDDYRSRLRLGQRHQPLCRDEHLVPVRVAQAALILW